MQGIEVNASDEWIDFKTPIAKILLHHLLVIPEIDNDQRSISVQQGMRRAKILGRFGPGNTMI